jgi:hypothetical protein
MCFISEDYIMDQKANLFNIDTPLRQARLRARNALFASGHREFKTRGSAKWADITRLKNGHLLVQIQHGDMAGVEPEMLLWWFRHLGCHTTWNGKDFSGPEVSLYHLWHFRDHVAVTPLSDPPSGGRNLGFAEGADSEIDEHFGETGYHVKNRMHTSVLNEHEFTFQIMQGGRSAGHITHIYEKVPGGCSFYAETEVGMDGGIGAWLFNRLVLPHIYSWKEGERWIVHNIEETGRTQDCIRILYENQDKVYFKENR